jgi:hypothetical protein
MLRFEKQLVVEQELISALAWEFGAQRSLAKQSLHTLPTLNATFLRKDPIPLLPAEFPRRGRNLGILGFYLFFFAAFFFAGMFSPSLGVA